MLNFFNQTAFHVFGAATSWAEVIGFVSGGLCVWYTVRQNIWNFPLGLVNAIFFGILFLNAGLYSDSALQVVYLVLNAFGWFAWLRLGPNSSRLRVGVASRAQILGALVFVLVFTALDYRLLVHLKDSAPFLDALTTGLSLAAQTLLSFKKIQNWFFWIAADLIYIPLYWHRDLVLTSLIYVIFLFMCFRGLWEWKRAQSKDLIEDAHHGFTVTTKYHLQEI